ncbi:MAG: HAMP domain-containing sensor histidine kinase, partial [Spirochaetaceae bacterium]|nr:HAMP domain-containing sensor histidine kinase [Spirochaetaceae bacterium]
ALHRLSSRLQERTDHMEDFMADLVHEMKNPVAGILSAVELAERSAQAETKRFLDVINREGRRIRHLLEDLRELISVDVRLDRKEREPVDVGLLLKNLVAGYYRSEKAGVKIVLQDQSDSCSMVSADPDRLGQAVLNLLDNAVSFSPKDGRVDIRLEETPDGTVRISVLDRGPGIGVEDPEKIFVRWYTDRSEAEASDHTGLGLAIVKGIAEGYNGRIAADIREGGGSEFVLEFPKTVEK